MLWNYHTSLKSCRSELSPINQHKRSSSCSPSPLSDNRISHFRINSLPNFLARTKSLQDLNSKKENQHMNIRLNHFRTSCTQTFLSKRSFSDFCPSVKTSDQDFETLLLPESNSFEQNQNIILKYIASLDIHQKLTIVECLKNLK